MIYETVFDKKGRKIYPGDVLKVDHFIHYRRRQKMYMYKIASIREGKLVGLDVIDLEKKGKENCHSYPLWTQEHHKNTEIVQGHRSNNATFIDKPMEPPNDK